MNFLISLQQKLLHYLCAS